ncbi:MAG TPA: hypothetical protein VKC60_01035 [Opitutaceae bacterium]|nr:hypothetical protein [Opitutaceae bacterium]
MSVVWAAATVAIVERPFRRAALWMVLAAGFSALGFIHSYKITTFDVITVIRPAWNWTWAYLIMAATFCSAPYLFKPDDSEVQI